MAVIHVPAPFRPLTGGQADVEAAGGTLGEVIDGLEAAYPGVRARMVEGDRIRPNLAVFIDGEQAHPHLSTRLGPHVEIHFMPAIAGGA